MIQCNSYELVYLQNIPYLIPYGQQTANLQKSIRLNETTAFIWERLLQEKTPDQIVQDILDNYMLSEKDRPIVQKDLAATLTQLEEMHAINASAAFNADCSAQKSNEHNMQKDFCFRIGPLIIHCESEKNTSLSAFFKDFLYSSDSQNAIQHIVIKTKKPKEHLHGTVLIRRADILIEEMPFFYRICVSDQPDFYEMRIAKDASFVEIFCNEALDTEFLFHMIRFPVLLIAQKKGCFFLHSASILYKEKAWLFSAGSGTGKSTHTKLWHTFLNTPYLNGDLNMIGIRNDRYMVYGQPWCGTSKLYTAKDHPLGGVVFLKQSKTDQWHSLSMDQKIMQLLCRLISPCWTKEMLYHNLSFAKKTAQSIPLFSLECTATKDACHAAQDGILFYLNEEKDQ